MKNYLLMAKTQITKLKKDNITWNMTNYELDDKPPQDPNQHITKRKYA